MVKKAFFGFAFLCLASSASAQWQAIAGYLQFDPGSRYSDLGAIVLGAGYSFPVNEVLTIIPSVRVGHGVKDAHIPLRVGVTENGQPVTYEFPGSIEVSQFYGLQLRGQYELTSKVYVFAAPSYSSRKDDMSYDYTIAGVRHRGSDTTAAARGFGVGAGAGVKFNDSTSAELSYEKVDFGDNSEIDIVNAQLRFSF